MKVSPRDVLPVLDDVLLPAIVRALQDHTSAVKQEAAVKALGQVSEERYFQKVLFLAVGSWCRRKGFNKISLLVFLGQGRGEGLSSPVSSR